MNNNEARRQVAWCDYLSATEAALIRELISFADFKDLGLRAPFRWPTEPELAAGIKRTVRTLRRVFPHLEYHGWVARQRGDGRGHRSSYVLLPRTPDRECDCSNRPPVKGDIEPAGKGDIDAGKGDIEPSLKGDIEAVKGDMVSKKGGHGVQERVTRKGDISQVRDPAEDKEKEGNEGRQSVNGSRSSSAALDRWPVESVGEEENWTMDDAVKTLLDAGLIDEQEAARAGAD